VRIGPTEPPIAASYDAATTTYTTFLLTDTVAMPSFVVHKWRARTP
jgi:hypothetical protein